MARIHGQMSRIHASTMSINSDVVRVVVGVVGVRSGGGAGGGGSGGASQLDSPSTCSAHWPCFWSLNTTCLPQENTPTTIDVLYLITFIHTNWMRSSTARDASKNLMMNYINSGLTSAVAKKPK